VSGQHLVSKVFDADGDVVSTRNVFTPLVAAGGNLVVAESSLDRLDMALVAPTLQVAPGEYIDIWFALRATGASTVGVGAADFANSAQLRLAVDPGVVLTDDSGAPLDWVTAIPEPATAWLFGVGLLALLGCRRARASGMI
jgi:hypothetical protein